MKEVGSSAPKFFCTHDFEGYVLSCKGFGDFIFNRHNNRFLSTYMLGYYSDDPDQKDSVLGPEGSNTPAMSIGKCSPL